MPTRILRQVFQDEKLFLGFVSANLSLGGLQAFVQKVQPGLNMVLTIVQIVVGVTTVVHVVRKWIQAYRKKHEIIHPDSP